MPARGNVGGHSFARSGQLFITWKVSYTRRLACWIDRIGPGDCRPELAGIAVIGLLHSGACSWSIVRVESVMARVCQVTGKKPMVGNNVSHANNKSKRRFLPNLHSRRFWVESENRWVRLRISNAALRLIDKVGVDQVVANLRVSGAL